MASLKAQSSFYRKDYTTSLNSFNILYDHWHIGKNSPSYVTMLIKYSHCLKLKDHTKEVDKILSEALEIVRDNDPQNIANLQNIEFYMLCNNSTDESFEVGETKPYAQSVRDKLKNSTDESFEVDETKPYAKSVRGRLRQPIPKINVTSSDAKKPLQTPRLRNQPLVPPTENENVESTTSVKKRRPRLNRN